MVRVREAVATEEASETDTRVGRMGAEGWATVSAKIVADGDSCRAVSSRQELRRR